MSISELSKAIKRNDIEAVKTLLENGSDFNSYRTVKIPSDNSYARIYAITDAIKGGNAEIIGFMLSRNPNFLLIHKSAGCTVKIDFYACPAVLEFKTKDAATYIDINGKFGYGNQEDGARFASWLKSVERELEQIVWDWNSGMDEFELIRKDVIRKEGNMFELVPSEWMRNYLKEQGRELSDKEKATIIWNAPKCRLEERLNALEELSRGSSDEELKKQILERIDYENAAFEELKKNTDGKFVYIVEGDDEGVYGVFADYEAAEEYAAQALKDFERYGAVFSIEKYSVVSKDNPGDKCCSSYFACASVHFDKSGEIRGVYSSEITSETIDEQKGRFEDMYFKIPFGMEYGIVKYVPDNTYGVLAKNKADWDRFLGKWSDDALEFGDIQVIVYELTDKGIWSHGHINPLYLEPVAPENVDYSKNAEKQAAFLAAANALVEYFKNETEENGKLVLDTAKAYAEVCHRLNCKYLMKASEARDIFS